MLSNSTSFTLGFDSWTSLCNGFVFAFLKKEKSCKYESTDHKFNNHEGFPLFGCDVRTNCLSGADTLSLCIDTHDVSM